MSICPGSYTDGGEVLGVRIIQCPHCARRWAQIGSDRQIPRHTTNDRRLRDAGLPVLQRYRYWGERS